MRIIGLKAYFYDCCISLQSFDLTKKKKKKGKKMTFNPDENDETEEQTPVAGESTTVETIGK